MTSKVKSKEEEGPWQRDEVGKGSRERDKQMRRPWAGTGTVAGARGHWGGGVKWNRRTQQYLRPLRPRKPSKESGFSEGCGTMGVLQEEERIWADGEC